MTNEYAVIFGDWVIGQESVFLPKFAVLKWLVGSIFSFKNEFLFQKWSFFGKNGKIRQRKGLFFW